MIAVEIQGLVKMFKRHTVLNKVSLKIHAGETYGMIGNNGVGKTTLLRCVLGLLKPTSGNISVFGENAYTLPDALKQKIAVTYDSPMFVPGMSALDNLLYFCMPYTISKNDVQERYHQYASKLQLKVTDQHVGEYSLGMRQKLSIIRSLITEPTLLVMDEPFNGLDPTSKFALKEVLKDYQHTTNCTALISSHDLANLQELANQYIFLKDGVVAAAGKLDEILDGRAQTDLYKLTIEADGIQKVCEAIRDIQGITIVEQRENVIIVRFTSDSRSLFQLLSEHRLPILEIQRVHTGLEGLFAMEVH